MLPAFDELVCENLAVVCKPCHSLESKAQKKRLKEQAKAGKK
jgi:hypothetical protein